MANSNIKATGDSAELLGLAIDRLDNVANMLSNRHLSDAMHVQQLRLVLPEIVADLKKHYEGVVGDNPWE